MFKCSLDLQIFNMFQIYDFFSSIFIKLAYFNTKTKLCVFVFIVVRPVPYPYLVSVSIFMTVFVQRKQTNIFLHPFVHYRCRLSMTASSLLGIVLVFFPGGWKDSSPHPLLHFRLHLTLPSLASWNRTKRKRAAYPFPLCSFVHTGKIVIKLWKWNENCHRIGGRKTK